MTEQRHLRTLLLRKAEGWQEMLFELAVKFRASGRRIVKSRAELINSTAELAECFLPTFFLNSSVFLLSCGRKRVGGK